MTPEDIERMAREADFSSDGAWFYADGPDGAIHPAALARFAALVRAQALDQAARVCISIADVVSVSAMGARRDAGINTANSCAAAIRALGDTK